MEYVKVNEQRWNEFLNCVRDDICLDVKEGEYKGQTIVWYEKLYDVETIVLGTQQYAKYYIKEPTVDIAKAINKMEEWGCRTYVKGVKNTIVMIGDLPEWNIIKTELTRLQGENERLLGRVVHFQTRNIIEGAETIDKLKSQLDEIDIELILGIISDYKEYVGDNMLEMTSNSIKSQEKVLLAILNKESE